MTTLGRSSSCRRAAQLCDERVRIRGGTAAGMHPYPMIVRDLQSVIGREARAQLLDRIGVNTGGGALYIEDSGRAFMQCS